MFFLNENPVLSFLATFLAALPEPIELFAFGVALVIAVALLRWLLNRSAAERSDEELSKKGVTNN